VTPPPPENHCRETGTDQQTVSDSPQPLPRNEKPLFKPVWSPTSMPEDPIELCMHPNDAVGQERLLRSRSWLKGRRLHIVGGRSEDRILSDIADCLGVPPENVDWESCERRTKPKLSSWTNLRADRDVAVCITGHIGHASSEKALELAGRARVVCLSVRCGGDIVEGLQAMCADRGPGVGE
jgi:hypothetical protein